MRKREIPQGFKTLLPKDSLELEKIYKTAASIFKKWGYLPITPPSVEYLETFTHVDKTFENISFKFVDKNTGKMLALRPDFTPQIARTVASSFKNEEPPLRFFYSGNIFKDEGNSREFPHIGFEIIGVDDIEADAEVVSILVNILEELGLESFQIDIGHVKFIEGAIEELRIKDRGKFLKLLSSKDFSGIEIFTEEENLSKNEKEKIEILVNLYGKSDILETAEKTFSHPLCKEAIETLRTMFDIVKTYGFEKNVIFDLSERKGLNYHTGITFEIFHPLIGTSFGSGGRYNSLLKEFGRDIPATGAGIRIDLLHKLLRKKNSLKLQLPLDIYIIDTQKELKKAFEVAKLLRQKGYNVARDIVKRPVGESVKIALEKGFKYIIVLNPQKEKSKIVIHSSSQRIIISEEKTPEKTVEKIIQNLEAI